jgi:hypothetical protein
LRSKAESFVDSESGTGFTLTREAGPRRPLAATLNEVKGLGAAAVPSLAQDGAKKSAAFDFDRAAHFAHDRKAYTIGNFTSPRMTVSAATLFSFQKSFHFT